ncbi:hypothetical protein GCM10027091_74090 [Streptomyces daliensis]
MSATFTAPPSTDATTRSISTWSSSTSGNISGVIRSAPSGIRFSGTSTDPAPVDATNWAGVGASNNARTDTDTPRVRSFSTSWTARRECPPSWKKLSSTPTDPSPRMSANTAHRISSCTVAGARPAPVTYSGAGSAGRSSLPFAVSGNSGSVTNAAGTM